MDLNVKVPLIISRCSEGNRRKPSLHCWFDGTGNDNEQPK
jgi:hypothetical protein